MGMSTHIIGIRDLEPNSQFEKMINVKLACEAAGVDYPDEVCNYFDGSEGDSVEYLREELLHRDLEDVATTYSDTACSGYEIRVEDIPKDVKTIRFYNAW